MSGYEKTMSCIQPTSSRDKPLDHVAKMLVSHDWKPTHAKRYNDIGLLVQVERTRCGASEMLIVSDSSRKVVIPKEIS